MDNKGVRSDTDWKIGNLKRHIFYELLNLAGSVFIVVRYDPSVVVGRRGFLPEEEEKGLILVFNRRTNLRWEDGFIDTKLVFGTAVEHCIIPEEHIIVIYSPEMNTQFTCHFKWAGSEVKETPAKEIRQPRVVKVDFRKKEGQ